nr:hypothetical protein [Tanacetum cinerariifolium]
MVPNVDEASTSHSVFNERLNDAYFVTRTSFHDPSNVHTFYQPYPHEKKWTKGHPLHKITGDSNLSVRTRGKLANSCLFSCLLSSIEPVNVAEALRDADWVSAMQEELDQLARLKSNVHTFYQPYRHEKKWTKDHPLYKIIGDLKLSVRTRALRDVDWVSAMQEELDQFARLKVWRLVPRPEGKSVIKTKWNFKNNKDESSLVIRNKARLVAVGYSQQEGIVVTF